MSSYSRQQLENYLRTIDVKGVILDIGGGVQTLDGRARSFTPIEYTILDNGAEKGLHDKWIEPNIQADICKDFVDKDEIEKYDQIFMIEVSEYLTNPNKALSNIYKMLKKGGEFISSWHFVQPIHPPKGRDFFRYTPDCVEMLMKTTGFQIMEHIMRRTIMVDLKDVWGAERMRGWKDFDNTIVGSVIRVTK